MTDLFDRLREIKPEIERDYPIRLLGVFGSHARGEARPDSDVDALFESTGPMSYFKLAEIELRLEELLGMSVDLFSESGMKKHIRDRAVAEAVPI